MSQGGYDPSIGDKAAPKPRPRTYLRFTTSVEAIRWDGGVETPKAIRDMGADFWVIPGGDGKALLRAGEHGAQGFVAMRIGEWVVKGGDPVHFWPISATQFANTYRPVHDEIRGGS